VLSIALKESDELHVALVDLMQTFAFMSNVIQRHNIAHLKSAVCFSCAFV
jgi:hypothetical protein